MDNCNKCGLKLKQFNYKLFSACLNCSSVFIDDKYIGKLDYDTRISCNCGSRAVRIVEEKEFPVINYACLKCGRIHSLDIRSMMLFTKPDMDNIGLVNIITIHNSGMVLNEDKTKIIGRANYMKFIPYNIAIKEDLEFANNILKGYAVYDKDEYNLNIGVKYIPIDINTGEIKY